MEKKDLYLSEKCKTCDFRRREWKSKITGDYQCYVCFLENDFRQEKKELNNEKLW